VCASVVTCCDAAPVLDPAEQVLDLVTLAVELLVVMILDLALGFGRDAGGNALAVERGAELGRKLINGVEVGWRARFRLSIAIEA
jgi:hypothetical protein